ncbi:hypothetical protein EE612_031139 [Oryza sativa]|nr:hypothetical protein EE612_031139 [Oryza sativa]
MRPRVVQVWCLIVLAMIVVFAATPAMAVPRRPPASPAGTPAQRRGRGTG